MAENQAFAASQISESSLGSYRNLTSIGMFFHLHVFVVESLGPKP